MVRFAAHLIITNHIWRTTDMNDLLPETQKRISEIERQDTARLAENKRRNDLAHAEWLAKLEQAKQTKLDALEEERVKKEEAMKARIRNEFLRTRPAASDEDFERLYPQLRDEDLLRPVEGESERQLASDRSMYNLL